MKLVVGEEPIAESAAAWTAAALPEIVAAAVAVASSFVEWKLTA